MRPMNAGRSTEIPPFNSDEKRRSNPQHVSYGQYVTSGIHGLDGFFCEVGTISTTYQYLEHSGRGA